jgi:hypothetical protein
LKATVVAQCPHSGDVDDLRQEFTHGAARLSELPPGRE